MPVLLVNIQLLDILFDGIVQKAANNNVLLRLHKNWPTILGFYIINIERIQVNIRILVVTPGQNVSYAKVDWKPKCPFIVRMSVKSDQMEMDLNIKLPSLQIRQIRS